MKYQRRVSLPLAATQFNDDDDKKKKKKKKDSYENRPKSFTNLSPDEIRAKKAKIRALEKTNPTKAAEQRKALMKELKKGYYKN